MMNAQERWGFRLGILTEMVELAPSRLGRTAIMKLVYLLQTLKGVPLGYSFGLYIYGPYENDVLNDLGQAESMRAVRSSVIPHPKGYGYEFSPGPARDRVKSLAGPELAKYRDAIAWALDEFGSKTAGDLELLSTIIYADREASQRRRCLPVAELCRQVREIKPRFAQEYISASIASLAEKGLLIATDRVATIAPE
jgi:uncharacterized protein